MLEIVGQDRIVGEPGLETARVHVAQDVRNGVVRFDLAEQSRLFQSVDESRADLGADHFALQIFRRGIGLGVALRHDQTLAIGVDGVREVDHLLAHCGREHRRRDDVDLVRRQRRDQRGKLHWLDLHLKTGILADLGDEVDHHALNAVALGIEEGEGHAGRRRAHLEHLLRRPGRGNGKCENRGRGLNETFEEHRTLSLGWAPAGVIPLTHSQLCVSPSKPIFTIVKLWSHWRRTRKGFSCT